MGELHDRPDRPEEPDEEPPDRLRRGEKHSWGGEDDRWDPVLYDDSRFSDFELAEDAKAADDPRRTTAVLESDEPDTRCDEQAKRSADYPATRIERETPEQLTSRRAGELQEQIPERARGRVTMAVGVAESGDGREMTVVSTANPEGTCGPG
ncbi:MAG: hypothetical protein GEV03_11670 [Streptosporangiales bacterium]|nr:hypothetical protein [Streptosporangiales bacterium]